MRLLFIGALVLWASLLSVCASLSGPDRPFSLIKSQEGWVQLNALPTESMAMKPRSSTGTMMEDGSRTA